MFRAVTDESEYENELASSACPYCGLIDPAPSTTYPTYRGYVVVFDVQVVVSISPRERDALGSATLSNHMQEMI